MLINRKDMKRKRRDDCSSPLLDDSPKRTKVHAQRKFAQGSNVNSPVITPVKELEKQDIDVMPEPVELLPIKRPNTEDFLTFLCFRGTPILPPSLNFFNTASIVDTNGQVHEIKSESPKNGPIDTSQLTKSGSGSAERPFIAFGVRKRADPIVISRQMDKKRRHALALQALRRKYQEQKMAKIRAVTISKLSEKVTNKTLVRSNSISKSEKSETVTKKTNTIQKTKVNVVEPPKQVKVTRSVKAGLRPQIKQKMCLRSFRGRFVQRELQFRNVKKRAIPTKKLVKKDLKVTENKEEGSASDYSSDDEKPLSKSPVGVKIKSQPKVVLAKIVKKSAPGPKKPAEISFRITRSNKFLNTKVVSRRQQIKQRMLMTTPKTIVKPRTLRSHSAQKGKTLIETKQKIFPKTIKKPIKSLSLIKESSKKESSPLPKKVVKTTELKSEPKENPKKDETNTKKETQSTDKKVTSKTMEISKKDASPAPTVAKSKTEKSANVKRELENAKEKPGTLKKEPENVKKAKIIPKQTKKPESINDNQLKKEILSKKKPTVILKKEIDKSDTHIKKEPHKKETNSETEEQSKSGTLKSNVEVKDKIIETKSQRPTRRTKEAAAIYMEILSHKLVNESRIDDDNVSIDSFPELPNVKKTEQRENELKAKAGCSKNSEGEDNKKVIKSKEKDADVSEMKVLRSSDKKKVINTQKHNEETDKNTKTCEKVTLKQNEGLEKNTKIIEKNVQKQNDTKVNEKNVQKQNDGSEKAAKINEKSCQKQCESSDKNVKTTEKSIQKHNENVEKNTKVNEKNVQKQSDNSDKTNVNEKTGQKINECFTQNTVINEKIAHKSNEISDKNTKLGEKIVLKQSDSCDKNTKICEKNGDKKTEAKKEDEGKSKKVVEEIKKIITKTDSVKEELVICDRKTRSAIQEKIVEKAVASPLEKVKEIELKVHINPLNVDVEGKKNTTKIEIKEPPAKKKCAEKSNKEEHVEPEASIKQSKTKKTEDKSRKNLEEASKRQTRNSSQNTRLVDSDDSDESFHVDIRIPRKKQNTRSKVSKSCESDNDSFKSVKKLRRNYKECSSSESDRSTTSDVNVKPVKLINNKNKKFTKTRGQQKADQSFSDSDEEPLSKLTQSRTTKSKEMSISTTEATNVEKKVKVENETVSKDIKAKTDEIVEKESFKKPKRECAKRPQNYLPMFSSSDEEEYFHGFVKSETKPRATKIPPSTSCTHLPSTSDLSYKDIGRRFGKGKVNMSTEQIEKWLKDAAMAGSSVKNENDAMLKFGEKIPTETSHSVARSIDTEKLKSLLITSVEKQDSDMEKKLVPVKRASTEAGSSSAQSSGAKPLIGDRKLIFRNKDKGSAVSNVNAFSASNENSVYAFGEEAEDVMKTPFRRPTRRPSSTGTSKSEDESSKFEELPKAGQFRKPPLLKQDSTKSKDSVTVDDSAEEKHATEDPKPKISPSVISSKVDKKPVPSTSMVPPTMTNLKHSSKQAARSLDVSEELKYKVPSSPSASSSSSAKLYKRQTKFRVSEVMPVKLPDFPGGGLCAQLVEAPTFHPTEKEFQDPLEYIEKIRSNAEQFGICRIVPPSTFKPECKVTDDMRFTAYNQYVHKMLHRWGPNFKELMAIKKYLSTQNISLTHSPWIGGMEVDLPRLYQTVQSLGGLKEVIEKKKWPKVSDAMKIPKSAQDRVTKLDDIYCKYLLPYDTLSPAEREKLFHEVETEWAKRESKSLLKAQQNIDDNTTDMESDSDDEAEECIVKGRNMALNAFYRIARNTMSMWFKTPEPLAEEVEQEFWKHVNQRQNHICVHSGSIDSGSWGYGFAVSKNSPFARHAWNLKVLTNNSGSVLRSIGPVMGVTVPTLHVGMVFSSCCWYRDPHSLPWIEYLHTGGNKIWYGIPDSASAAFHAAMKAIVPNYCRNKSLWLPSDTVMVPPSLLVEHGVSLSRIVQEPGQFIVVFPKVFTSSLSTGYVVSESVYFAPPYWLKTGRVVFNELRNSCEPSMFSLDRLLLSIVSDSRSNVEVLKQIIPAVQELCDKEKSARDKIKALGVSATEKLPLPEAPQIRKKKKLHSDDGEYECEICRMNLFVSMVTESQENAIFCLEHAAEHIEKKKILSKHCKLTYTYDDQELEGLVEKIKVTIVNKMQKKVPNKFAGMPTLLGK